MPRLVLLYALAATTLSAAVIRGTIVENRSGKPLSRAQVTLQPIAGTPGTMLSVRTNNLGSFEFQSLPAGVYLVKAARLGFLPLEYGQKQWNSAGQPIFLTQDEASFLSIRLLRYGSINGTIQDENEVGIPNQDVVAYRANQPPQLAARGRSDERGIYRIPGLEPGNYLVRTAGNHDEEITYSPTFSKEAQRVEDARTVPVFLDEDSTKMDVRPAFGALLSISGVASTDPPDMPVTVTLASDMGRQTSEGHSFHFGSLPPGQYELYAEAPAIPGVAPFQAAFLQVFLSRQSLSVPLPLQVVRETRFDFSPAPAGDASAMQVIARRKDLAGVGPAIALKLINNRAMLGPGRWEVMLVPPSGYYVSDFFGPGFGRSRTRPDGWNEFLVTNTGNNSVRFTLSGGPASLHGMVKSNTDPVVGAPVYLEAYDPDTRKRLTDLRATRTDTHGAFRFEGLAPGTYRILSTFEYLMPDTAAMDYAAARSLRIDARTDQQSDLDLYGIR